MFMSSEILFRSKLLCVLAFVMAFGLANVGAVQPAFAAEKMIAITGDVDEGLEIIEEVEADVIELRTDRPQVIKLDREVANILIGNDIYLNIFPDSRKTLILMPVNPGATYFRAIDAEGNTIIEKRVIVAAPKEEYIRVRQTCAADDELCSFDTIYYCPDMCHNIYNYSNDERINNNEQIRNAGDDEDGEDSSDGDNPADLSDASESQPQ